MNVDPNAKYLESHEWSRKEGDLIVCGISDHAQESLSDVVFVELPEVGATFSKGDVFGVVESVKAASDLYMSMDGEIVEINEILEDEPELINSDPFGAAWLIKFKPSDPSQWDDLLTPDEYQEVAEAEE
ncbi:MAG TPA: glycine cleavage system protein GcvH [Anaerolineae bacterium]|nr:glycine cleavage system protein GcvH [Anaerolineae bacterium]MCB0180543.1 glycine cleavage system protein GcvH [Anaerolineae bacterium]MCB9108111.1 glycine cleavage system protein GcvH [Anaerolineales bacterium]HRV95302.1 glycine cleavage system protein GcvH [Anaerolineae bacterium]